MYGMRDVARLAGVSVATVSAVINGKGRVSAQLTAQVHQAMGALDYYPNQVARSLKLQQSHIIGMVVPDITNPFFGDVIRGVETEARVRGYSLILCDSNEDPLIEKANLDMLFARRADGALIAPSDVTTALGHVILRRLPAVFFDRIPPGFTGSAVLTNNLEAAFDATRYLIDLGHRRLAIIAGRLDLSNGSDRLEGFRKALQQADLALPESYLQQGDFQVESGYRCGLNLLRLTDPPTAIFCCNNQMTLGLMKAVAELDVSCPAQVSVLTFDDFLWTANFSPRLTTVAQPSLEMGKQAMLMLLDKIRAFGQKPHPDEEKVLVFKSELRMRDSTAAPR